jgi:hypothetical protein
MFEMNLNSFCWKSKLPIELETKIFSYLYFSDEVSLKIKPVNDSIKKYNDIRLACLCYDYDLKKVSYFILKYFLYDKINSDKLVIDYTILSKTSSFQHEELERIFLRLRLLDVLRIVKYIKVQGFSSDFYVD